MCNDKKMGAFVQHRIKFNNNKLSDAASKIKCRNPAKRVVREVSFRTLALGALSLLSLSVSLAAHDDGFGSHDHI